MSDRLKDATNDENTDDHEITIDNPGTNLAAIENTVNVKTLQSWFNETTG